MYLPPPPPRWLRLMCSKAVVLLLLIYCLMYFPLFVGVLCLSLFCYALLCVHSSFAIILKRKRKLVAFLLLSYRCIVTLNAMWLFLNVSWVGLQCVIVVCPDHTQLLLRHRPNSVLTIGTSLKGVLCKHWSPLIKDTRNGHLINTNFGKKIYGENYII